MSGAARLIRELAGAGVTIERRGDQLEIDGPEVEIDSRLERLVQEKPNLLRLIDDGMCIDPEWQAFFDARTAIVKKEQGLRSIDAELSAFLDAVDKWLVLQPPEPARLYVCSHCGKEIGGKKVVPMVMGQACRGVLHSDCASVWRNKRQLAAMGEIQKRIYWPRIKE